MCEPAQLDYLDERAVVLHIRALLNLHDLLLLGWDKEMENLRKKLIDVGWGDNMILEFIQRACEHTRYEDLLPHPVHGFDQDKF